MRIPQDNWSARDRSSLQQIAATRRNPKRSLLAAKISLRGLDAESNYEKARQRFGGLSIHDENDDDRTKTSATQSSWIKPVPTWDQKQKQEEQQKTCASKGGDSKTVVSCRRWKKPTPMQVGAASPPTNQSRWKRPSPPALNDKDRGEENEDSQKEINAVTNMWKQKDANSTALNSRSNTVAESPPKWKKPDTSSSLSKADHTPKIATAASSAKWKKPNTPTTNSTNHRIETKETPQSPSSAVKAPIRVWKKPIVTAEPLTEKDNNINATTMGVKKWENPAINTSLGSVAGKDKNAKNATNSAGVKKWKKPIIEAEPVTENNNNTKISANPAVVKKWKEAEAMTEKDNSTKIFCANPEVVKKWKKPTASAVAVTAALTKMNNNSAVVKKWERPAPMTEKDSKTKNSTTPAVVKKWKKPTSSAVAVTAALTKKDDESAVIKKWKRPAVAAATAASTDKDNNNVVVKKWKRPAAAAAVTAALANKDNNSAVVKKWKMPTVETAIPTEKDNHVAEVKKWKKPVAAVAVTEPPVEKDNNLAAVKRWQKPTAAGVVQPESENETKVTVVKKWKRPVTAVAVEEAESPKKETPAIFEKWKKLTDTATAVESTTQTDNKISDSTPPTDVRKWRKHVVTPAVEVSTPENISTATVKKWKKPTEASVDATAINNAKKDMLSKSDISRPMKKTWKPSAHQTPVESTMENDCVIPSEAKETDVPTEPTTETICVTPSSLEGEIAPTEPTAEAKYVASFKSDKKTIAKGELINPDSSSSTSRAIKVKAKSIDTTENKSTTGPSSNGVSMKSAPSSPVAKPIVPCDVNSDIETLNSLKKRPSVTLSNEIKNVLQNAPALSCLPPELRIDGSPLDHWDMSNFEKKRDNISRQFFEPKDGEDFYKQIFDDHAYEILRKTSIEQPYFSKYNRFFPTQGHFCCKACGNPLYDWKSKFNAENGWPAFGTCVRGSLEISTEVTELGDGVDEIHCLKCRSHIGNIVLEENWGKGGVRFKERHRVNGRSLKYIATNLAKRTTANFTLLYKQEIEQPVGSLFR